MKGLTQDRERQLHLEKDLDEKLRSCPCTDKVFKYLLKTRELNRVLTLEQMSSSFYHVPELYKQQLQITDKLQNILQTHTNYELCDHGLDDSIKIIDNRLSH